MEDLVYLIYIIITVCVYFEKKMFFSKTFHIFFLLDVNFKYLTIGLHILIILSIFIKF